MTDADLQEENLRRDLQKKALEIQALERNARLDPWKTILAFAGAFAFLGSFVLDSYKVREQRDRDRRVAIVTEFDQMYIRTLTALTHVRPDTVLFRVNLDAFKEKLTELEERLSTFDSQVHSKQLITFIAESKGFADSLLNSLPVKYEFTQWADGIAVEAIWEARSASLAPDFSQLFTPEQDKKWGSVRNAALKAIREQFSLLGDSEHHFTAEFRTVATQFQKELHDRLR